MKKKLIGRMGYSYKTVGNSELHSFYVQLRCSDSHAQLSFQSFGKVGDNCSYGLQLSSILRLAGYECARQMKLLAMMKAAFDKETAPRARCYEDGKPFIRHCDRARMVQAAEKLGLNTRSFEDSNAAYDWTNEVPEVSGAVSISAA